MNKELAKQIAEVAKNFSEPLDIDNLIKKGYIVKKGKNYYLNCDPKELPETASRRLSSIEKNKNGIKITFSKDTKSSIAAANKLSGLFDQ